MPALGVLPPSSPSLNAALFLRACILLSAFDLFVLTLSAELSIRLVIRLSSEALSSLLASLSDEEDEGGEEEEEEESDDEEE